MEKIEKTLQYNNLLSVYEKLLSSTQIEILEAYFRYDLSISEIAEERGISRAAVEDALQKGCLKLLDYEDKLHMLEIKGFITEISAEIRKNPDLASLIAELDKIEGRLK